MHQDQHIVPRPPTRPYTHTHTPPPPPQESYHFFAKFNQLALPEVTLRPHNFRQVSDRQVEFTLTSTGGAAVQAFWDAQPAGHFSTNSVTVRPCEPLKVNFYSTRDVTAADLERSLTVWTLNGALQGKQAGGWPASGYALTRQHARAPRRLAMPVA